MGQVVRFSLTGVLYFPYSTKKSLKYDAPNFKKTLRGCLLTGNGFLPKEVSIDMLKANDVTSYYELTMKNVILCRIIYLF